MNAADIQTALFQALQSPLDGVLADLRAPSGSTLSQPAIYDHVPQTVDSDSDYPYVVIGDDTSIPFDTDTSQGTEATVTVHVWSRKRGRQEAKEIQRSIYDALHKQRIAIGDLHTVDVMWEYAETILDEDGITRHGVMRFRLTVEEQ